ncbi:hypothetical protein MGSAQ_001614, partial [marine sediment metagenome]
TSGQPYSNCIITINMVLVILTYSALNLT